MAKKKFREKVSRSLAKSLSFRILVVMSDLIIIFFLTHKLSVVISVTIFTNLASIILYYTHERVWNIIRWGKTSK